MAVSDYLSAADLKSANAGGFIREDVLNQIFNLDMKIPTPFLDSIQVGSYKNPYSEWAEETLATPNVNNAVIDGSDSSGVNNANTGSRLGNHAQISTKEVYVTLRAEDVDSVGSTGDIGYQTGRRTQELRRDIEAISLGRQASRADDGATNSGKSAGFSAFLKTNDFLGTSGVANGFVNTTKTVDAVVAGDVRALTLTMIRQGVAASYNQGGNPTTLMTTPSLVANINQAIFSANNIARPTAQVNATSPTDQVAQGYVNIMVTDFGTVLKIVPNRLQQTYTSNNSQTVADVFGYDSEYIDIAYLGGYRVLPLAAAGLSVKKMIAVDWMLRPKLERAHFVIRDVGVANTVTQ